MMHKTCPINYGHLADLQKALPTIDLNKKNLSFDKISPRDFYFCPFFSICTCMNVKLQFGNFKTLSQHQRALRLNTKIIDGCSHENINRLENRFYRQYIAQSSQTLIIQ